MIVSLTLIIILCIVPIIFFLGINALLDNEEFLIWLYSNYSRNAQIINTHIDTCIKFFGIICLAALPIPLILLLIDSYYRKYIKTLTKVIVIFAFIIPIMLSFLENLASTIVLLTIIIAIIIIGLRRRCSSCGKLFAITIIDREIIHSEDISILAKVENKNIHGQVIGTSEQYIPGLRQTYDEIYICKHCGYEKRKRRVAYIKKI